MSLRFTKGLPTHNGFIIVDETLFDVEDCRVIDKYDLEGNNLAELEKSAREQAELDACEIIYYDNEHIYSADDLYEDDDDEFLLTEEEIDSRIPDDEEDEEGWNDLAEHFFDD